MGAKIVQQTLYSGPTELPSLGKRLNRVPCGDCLLVEIERLYGGPIPSNGFCFYSSNPDGTTTTYLSIAVSQRGRNLRDGTVLPFQLSISIDNAKLFPGTDPTLSTVNDLCIQYIPITKETYENDKTFPQRVVDQFNRQYFYLFSRWCNNPGQNPLIKKALERYAFQYHSLGVREEPMNHQSLHKIIPPTQRGNVVAISTNQRYWNEIHFVSNDIASMAREHFATVMANEAMQKRRPKNIRKDLEFAAAEYDADGIPIMMGLYNNGNIRTLRTAPLRLWNLEPNPNSGDDDANRFIHLLPHEAAPAVARVSMKIADDRYEDLRRRTPRVVEGLDHLVSRLSA